MNIRIRFPLAAIAAAISLSWSSAAVPAPGQLFPEDTLVIVTVPAWPETKAAFDRGNYGKLWADPAMKPFRDKLEAKFTEKVLGDLEKELGIKTADYLPLLQGQLSVALLQNGWNLADDKTEPAAVLVLDTKDKSDQLKAKLAEARQKLTEAKRPLRTEKIRDVEFTTVVLEPMKPKPGAPRSKEDEDDEDDKGGKTPKKTELTFGQVDSALVVGDSIKAIEKIVAKLTGGSVPSVGDTAEFLGSEKAASFRGSYAFAWVNVAAVSGVLGAGADMLRPQAAALGIDPRKALAAFGIDGLRSLAFSAQQTPEGSFGIFAAGIPEAKRTGLFKLIAFEPKDAAPPAFVPADAVKFQRWRINGQKTWAALESMLSEVSPQLGGFLQMSISALGKDKDPDFDFKKAFVGNLGDDFVTFEKAPKGRTMAELSEPPGLTLLGSGNPDQLASGFKAAAGLLPTGGEDPKQREFNGKKIFGLKMGTPGQPDSKLLEVAASGGFVAMGSSPAVLEEYLRSAEGGSKPLKDAPGLAEAAQKVGGMGTGLFGYQDQRETTRAMWEALRQGGGLGKMIPGSNPQSTKAMDEWFDATLLPPFEQVAGHFGMTVYAGSWDAQGFSIRGFGPDAK